MHYLVNFIVFVVLFKIGLASYASEWTDYKNKMGKTYANNYEDKLREKIWKENYEYILNHNNKKNKEFYLDANPFCDMVFRNYFKFKIIALMFDLFRLEMRF
jgi:hypothetical protein